MAHALKVVLVSKDIRFISDLYPTLLRLYLKYHITNTLRGSNTITTSNCYLFKCLEYFKLFPTKGE